MEEMPASDRLEEIIRRAEAMAPILLGQCAKLSGGSPEVQTMCLVKLLRACLGSWMCAKNRVQGEEVFRRLQQASVRMTEDMIVKYIRDFNPAEIDAKISSELFNSIVGDDK